MDFEVSLQKTEVSLYTLTLHCLFINLSSVSSQWVIQLQAIRQIYSFMQEV